MTATRRATESAVPDREPGVDPDIPDTIDPVEARRIQKAIDIAAADFEKMDADKRGLKR